MKLNGCGYEGGETDLNSVRYEFNTAFGNNKIQFVRHHGVWNNNIKRFVYRFK